MNQKLTTADLVSTAAVHEPSYPFDDVLSAKAPNLEDWSQPPEGLPGVVIGQVVGVNKDGNPLVDFPGSHAVGPLAARTTVTIEQHQYGSDVALMFELGDRTRPLIMGLIQHPRAEVKLNDEAANGASANQAMHAEVDDERLVFEAQREIVLKCGNASITLTKAGKILIRGTYLLSRSSGVNRIKGGSVHIN